MIREARQWMSVLSFGWDFDTCEKPRLPLISNGVCKYGIKNDE